MIKRKSPWRAVSKLFPLPVGQNILVYAGKDFQGRHRIAAVNVDRFNNGREYLGAVCWGGYDYECDFEAKDVTHWMPMPKPPKLIL